MGKLLFGNNTVVPVKDLRTEMSAGNGISAAQLEEGTIAVDGTVIRNISSDAGSVVTQFGRRADLDASQTQYGRYTTISGEGATVIGAQAQGVLNTVALGRGAKATAPYGHAVAIGNQASAYASGGVSIGASANLDNRNAKDGAIAIGMNTDTGNARGSIVIGFNSKTYNNNDSYPSVVIGNNRDMSNGASGYNNGGGAVVIGGTEVQNGGTVVVDRRSVGSFSTAVGFSAGTEQSYNSELATALGAYAHANGTRTIAIGYGSIAQGDSSVAIGTTATASQSTSSESESAIAIGKNASTAPLQGYDNETRGGIAIGYAARASSLNYPIAIGRYAQSIGSETIAMGVSSYARARKAIQLGQGRNEVDNSINIFDYQLMKDGLIAKERLSQFTPQDGQVLTYDATNNRLVWKTPSSGGEGGGSYTLPVASKTTLGGVKVGDGLNITLDGVLSTKSQNTTWGTITGKLNNQTDLKNALDTKQDIIQYTVMPTPSAELDGQVAQYIGEDDVLYNKGNFYSCEMTDYPTASITSDTVYGSLTVDAYKFANFVSKYFYSGDLNSVPSKQYQIEYVNQFDGNGFILYENETSVYVKDVYKMGIDATGATPALGDKIYVNLNMHDATAYTWNKLLIDAQVSVNDTLVSTSTKQALSANQGRILNDKIKELSGISNFLAMWDADLHRARYLNDGYDYHAGDYFIVAQVAPTQTTITPTYTGNGTVKNIQVNVSTWESVYGTNNITKTFVINNSGKYVDQDTQEELDNLVSLGVSFTGNPSVGDIFTFTYQNTINYKPNGAHFDTSTDSYYIECPEDEQPQVSDMYFYDGEHWILLANHSRQIAIDEWLDDNSRNPVENRVVTDAIQDLRDNKLDSDSTEGLYATDNNGDSYKVVVGAGLALQNGEIVNTRTSAEWGNITGTLENQSDLVQYINTHGGGSSDSIQLADVFTKDPDIESDIDRLSVYRKQEYKGDYSDIFFKINSSYDKLLEARNDIYVTVSRSGDSNHARSKKKMRVMNDCNRFKTDKKLYCWCYEPYVQERYDYGDMEWKKEEGSRVNERYYFYTDQDYNSSEQDMKNADPVMHIISTYANGDVVKGNWGTSFNEVMTEWDNVSSYFDFSNGSFYRCPEKDIDTAISLNSNFSGSKRSSQYQYGNVVKSDFTKMICRVYNTVMGKVYLWASSWEEADDADVYAYMNENEDLIPNTIPQFMGDLKVWMNMQQFYVQDPTPVLVEKRNDLNWYKYSGSNFHTTINKLRLSTQDFPDINDGVSGYTTNWNSYWLDYPVRPVRLAECKIYLHAHPYAEGDPDVAREYSELGRKAYTFEEIESNQLLKNMLEKQQELIFVLPYDTAYLWLRLLGWQKWVYYRYYNEDNDVYAEPWERHSLWACIDKCAHNEKLGGWNRVFGFRKIDPGNDRGIYYQRLQFNTIKGSDLSNSHLTGNQTPLQRKIWVNGKGRQRVTEQI